MSGEHFDDPNRQAVGLDPAWAEGYGGSDTSGGGGPAAQNPLDAMTKDELIAHAGTLGVDVSQYATKAEIRTAIDEA